jgi:hypothetical protein
MTAWYDKAIGGMPMGERRMNAASHQPVAILVSPATLARAARCEE